MLLSGHALESGAKCCPPSFFTMCLYPLQFPDIVEFCETMANTGKTVIVAALDGTFQRKVKQSFWYSSCFGTLVEPTQQHLPCCLAQAFGSILNLVPLAESVVKLNAVCMECFREASYTKRLGAEQEVSHLEQKLSHLASPAGREETPSRELCSAATPQISLPG